MLPPEEVILNWTCIVLLVIFVVAFICGLIWNIKADDYPDVNVRSLKKLMPETTCMKRTPSLLDFESAERQSQKTSITRDNAAVKMAPISSNRSRGRKQLGAKKIEKAIDNVASLDNNKANKTSNPIIDMNNVASSKKVTFIGEGKQSVTRRHRPADENNSSCIKAVQPTILKKESSHQQKAGDTNTATKKDIFVMSSTVNESQTAKVKLNPKKQQHLLSPRGSAVKKKAL